jgi:hypothetical protein
MNDAWLESQGLVSVRTLWIVWHYPAALITRGEVWLRMVQNGGILVDIDGVGGTPSYVGPELGHGVVE